MSALQVLVVEDDPPLVDLLVTLLQGSGYGVTVAGDIQGALACVSSTVIDLVLTDGFSGRPDGVLASVEPIQRAAGTIPVILATAHAVALEEVQAAGFQALIPKPFQLDTFDAALRVVLNASC